MELLLEHTDGADPVLPYLSVRDASLAAPPPGATGGSRPSSSLIIAGDLYWPSVRDDEEQTQFADGEHPWNPFVSLIAAQDLSIVNMESPLTDATEAITKAGPKMRSLPSFAAEITAGGFGVLSLANNHIRDFDDQGIADTLATCREVGIATVGAGQTIDEAEAPALVPCGDLKVALVAAAESGPAAAGRRRAGGAPLRNGSAHACVAQAAASADAVVVLLHAGNEFYPFPAPHVVEQARSFARAGAAAVVVHHQHVPSGVEVFEGVPIAYGTGNFLFRMYYPYRVCEFHEGYLVRLSFSGATLCGFDLFPYFQSRGQRRVEIMGDEDVRSLVSRIAARSNVLADDELLEREWRRFCLHERARYLTALLGMSRFERRLVRLLGIWPWWRMRPEKVAALTNLLSTQSHREVAITILNEELERAGTTHKTTTV